MNDKTIYGTVILDKDKAHYGVYKYSAVPMYTDGSFILNVLGASSSIKQQVKQHVEELHNITVTTVTRG